MRVREQFTLITITLFAAITRFWNLATPKGYVFDEVYYVDGAKDYLKYGVEVDKTSPEFIVHPPIGKWMISIGIKLFGDNEFGWRFMGALLGTLSIALIYLIAKQLFNSIFLATSAAAMMALDGLHLVLSRTALLDIYLMFFVLLAFFTFIREKYWWTGITLGLAIGAKWSGIYYLLTLLAIALFFEIKNRNVNKILKRITQLFFIPSLIYIFSWSGWIFSKRGWDRQWADERGGLFSFIPAPIRSLWHYHAEMLNFHTGLTEAHSYSANPWSWLILGRPTSFYYQSPNTCGSSSCAQEVVALGTPLLWWLGAAALFVTFGYFVSLREKLAGLILAGIAAGYLPWFFFQKRTVFSFYAVVFEPFLILALIYCFAKLLEDPLTYKARKTALIGLHVAVALCFLYFFPVFVATITTYDDWHARMWFNSWI